MSDTYKFSLMDFLAEEERKKEESRQFFLKLEMLRDAPLFLNGERVELERLISPSLQMPTFEDYTYRIPEPLPWGFVFKDGRTEYGIIRQVNMITEPEPRIECTVEFSA